MDVRHVKGNLEDRIEMTGDREQLDRIADLLESLGIDVHSKKTREGWRSG